MASVYNIVDVELLTRTHKVLVYTQKRPLNIQSEKQRFSLCRLFIADRLLPNTVFSVLRFRR